MLKTLLTTTLICSMLVSLPFFGKAQVYNDEQIASFPQSFDPIMVHPMPDSSFLLGLQIDPKGEWGILKTDKYGHAYTGYLTNIQSSINSFPRAVVTTDGNNVFTGKKNILGTNRCLVAKFDLFGNAIWGLQYPDVGNDKLVIHDIIALDSGAVLLSGMEMGAGQPWISKVNANGQVAWERAYTGVGAAAFRVTKASNGGFYGAVRILSASFKLGRFDQNGLPIWYMQGGSPLNLSEVRDLKSLPNGQLAVLLGSNTNNTHLSILDTLGNVLSVKSIPSVGSSYGKIVATDTMIFVSLQSHINFTNNHGILAFDANGTPKRVTYTNYSGGVTDYRNGICKSVDGVAVLQNTFAGMNLILTDSMGSYPCADTHYVPVFTSATGTLAATTAPVPTVPILLAAPMAFSNMVGLFSNSQTFCTYCPNPQPVANFSYTFNGLNVQFQNLSSNSDSYSWTFGDNIVSTDSHPTVTYPSEGPRTVCLKAFSGCYSDTHCVSLPPLTDVEALNLLNPTFVTGNNSVQISFRNNTTSTINTLQVSYQVSNFPTVTETWSGALPAGDSAVYTFATPLNIPVPHMMEVQAWVKFPQPTLGNNPVNDTINTTVCMTMAGTYDVGGGNQDIATFAEAMNELRFCGQHGPVVVRVFGNPQGVFFQNVTAVSINTSGLYPVKITYGNGPLQDTVSITEVQESKGISFVGLNIVALTAFGAAVPCDGARFVFCDDVLVDSCDVSGEWGHLAFKGCNNFTVTNSHFKGGLGTVDHNVVQFPPLPGNSGVANFSNNTFEAIGNGVCIDGDQRNVDFIIDHNTFHGCHTGYKMMSDKDIRSIVFSNNRMIDTWSVGAQFGFQCSNCQVTNGTKIFNNMIQMRDTTLGNWAINVNVNGFLEIAHNAFWGRAYIQATPFSDVVRNNIFAGGQPDFLIQGDFLRDYNCYYRQDSSMEIMQGYPTLADLQAGFPGRDLHSFEADPGFVSATDLHTASTSVVDRGLSLTLTSTDIDGEAYSNPPDVGADENGLVIVTRPDNGQSELIVSPSVFQSYLDIQCLGLLPGTTCKAVLVSPTGQTLAETTFDLPAYRWNLSRLPVGLYGLTIHREGYRSVTVKVIHQP